ncbi:MAG: aldehyde dehydrogenase [Halobacteriovoraceae bacterium]|nr:aldehyde dehydrogenase [Halobacteriovoraceae bacterium]
MIRVGINGLGRIGRAIYRSNLKNKVMDIVAINEVNPDNDNIAYQLNYDTLYDQLEDKFVGKDHYICNEQSDLRVFHEKHIDDVDWNSMDVDIVIDSSGILDNVLRAHKAIEKNHLKKIIVTHSPEEVDFTMVLGANEEKLDVSKHQVISSSICDATAIGPVLRIIKENFGVLSGHITTLHPWLGYQNLMDGPASSWSVPGEIYHHFALGRSAIGNLIPKPTSALHASCKVVEGIDESILGSYSIRTPTHIVGCADLTLTLENKTTKEKIISAFENFASEQKWKIINNNVEPLVSLDFKASEFSANVDHRFTQLVNGDNLKLLLWYDNEWGYASRVVDQVKYVSDQIKETL